MAIERQQITPGSGEILVTGAAGGVGSVTIDLLSRRGFSVVASTSRVAQEDYLRSLGASRVVDRATLSEPISAPLQRQNFAAAVDTVGSHTLANTLAQTKYGGLVVVCGMAQGSDLTATVLPFILRGVTLTGANSVDAPRTQRERAWSLLARELDLDALDGITTVLGLGDLVGAAEQILQGRIRGRAIVDVRA